MTAKKLKQEFLEKKSLFKKGRQWLADKYGVSVQLVNQVLNDLADEKREYRNSNGNLDFLVKTKAEIIIENKEVELPLNNSVKIQSEKIEPFVNGNKDNVLVIGDLHQPYTLPGYLKFCRDIQEKYNCGIVVYIGDLVDGHSFSFHDHDPDGYSPDHEYRIALTKLKDWYYTFPEAKVCLGNHDCLPHRKLFSAGLPSRWLKNHKDLFESPDGYEWGFHHVINGVYYTHGTGVSGDAGAMKIANQNRQPAVIGHLHSVSNIKYSASYKDMIFAMTVGCGIDYQQYAFNYGRDLPAKPIISCGVVLKDTPIIETMKL